MYSLYYTVSVCIQSFEDSSAHTAFWLANASAHFKTWWLWCVLVSLYGFQYSNSACFSVCTQYLGSRRCHFRVGKSQGLLLQGSFQIITSF
jgi:hypothetical protein